MKKNESGFTLIELMIVVAIIGILAAIAAPQYQNFIARSQTAESVVMMDTAKLMVDDYVISNGSFPINKAALIALDVRITGTYGAITGINAPSLDSGTMVYKISGSGVNKNIANSSVWFSRELNTGIWACDSNLPSKFIPKGCGTTNSTPPVGS